VEWVSLREDLDDLNAKYGNRTNGGTQALVSALEAFLLSRSRAIFALAPKEGPALRKGETAQSAIENRRRRLRELAADLEAVKRAPWPSSLTKQKARAQLAELSVRGRPDVFGLVERGQPIEWPMLVETPVSAVLPSGEVVSIRLPPNLRELIDAAAFIAWAMGSTLVSKVEREIDEQSDDAHALTAEKRKEGIAEIAADTLAVEREEEALIEMAEADGLKVLRRHNADPRAVLGIV
jgi:hypothetical protein